MDNQKNAMKSKKGKMSGKTTFSSSAWVKPTQNALKEEKICDDLIESAEGSMDLNSNENICALKEENSTEDPSEDAYLNFVEIADLRRPGGGTAALRHILGVPVFLSLR